MQTRDLCKTLLLIVILALCGPALAFSEEIESAFSMTLEELLNAPHRNVEPPPLLWACGDYTKLKLIIRTNKETYDPKEPVYIMFFVRNNSDHEIHVQGALGVPSRNLFWKQFHSNYEEVLVKPAWKELFQSRKRNDNSLDHEIHIQDTFLVPSHSLSKKRFHSNDDETFVEKPGWEELFQNHKWEGREDHTYGLIQRGGIYVKLQPGQERQLGKDQLDDYFDLSKPDTYELTCFLATACFGQYFDPPLQSNTLTFRVLEDGEKAENTKDGMNPPKGEEVFKQPKPPKSVFYVFDDDEPHTPWMRTDNGRFIAKPRKIIDVSPEMYYRQRAKEQE